MAIIDFFDRGWRINPQRTAYLQDERSFSFTEVGELSCRIANALLAAGFDREAKGAVWAGNDVTAWTCTLGLWRAGMCWTPVGARNPSAENHFILDALRRGRVLYRGSEWIAFCGADDVELPEGSMVEVVGNDGVRLKVKKIG